jgi:uncharacterized membrane protein
LWNINARNSGSVENAVIFYFVKYRREDLLFLIQTVTFLGLAQALNILGSACEKTERPPKAV